MPKQKRASYDNAFKIIVIEYAEKNSNMAAERKFGCSEKMVRDWRKRKDKILIGPKGQKRNVGIRLRPYNELESDLLSWLMEYRQSKKVITRNVICMKARQLAKDVKYDAGLFKASFSWCTAFMKGNGIRLCKKSPIAKVSDNLQKVKQEMETESDDDLVKTNNNKDMENNVCEGTYDSVFDDGDELTFDVFLEDTDLDLNENIDENAVNFESDGAESFQEVGIKPTKTDFDVDNTPENLAFSETSVERDAEDIKANEEFENTLISGSASNEMEHTITKVTDTSNNSKTVIAEEEDVSDVDTDSEGEHNIHNQSDNMTSSEYQSTYRKSESPTDDMSEVEIKQECLDSTDEVSAVSRKNTDGVYHITMLVSSEQEDSIRSLFRDKNWLCWLKVLSDENIAGLIEGGYENIFPSIEKEGKNTNVFTEIKSPVVDDIGDGICDNQSLNAVEDVESNFNDVESSCNDEDNDTRDYEMAGEQHGLCLNDTQTKSFEQNMGLGFNIVKTENYEDDEIEVSGGSTNGMTREVISVAVDGQSRNDDSPDNSNNRFKCTACATSYMTNIMLKEHFQQHHNGPWLDFYCKDCFERFKSREELWKHRKTVQHAPNKNLASKRLTTPEELVAMGHIKCEICDRFYSHRRSMRQHMFSEHKDAVEKYQCGVCEEKFDIRDELYQHMRETKHTTSVSQLGNYQCDLCGRIINRYDSFKEHKLSCSKDKEALKKFPCDICGRLFRSKIRVNMHKRSVHVVSPSVCDICGYTCKNKASLTLHKFRHDPKNRKFPCDECSKSFFNNTLLKEHKRTHTKEKPFKCPICNYRCALKQNMYKHARNVHKTKFNGVLSDTPLT